MNLFSKILILNKERMILLPDEFIRKEIEVIAFPLNEVKTYQITRISSGVFFSDKLVEFM